MADHIIDLGSQKEAMAAAESFLKALPRNDKL